MPKFRLVPPAGPVPPALRRTRLPLFSVTAPNVSVSVADPPTVYENWPPLNVSGAVPRRLVAWPLAWVIDSRPLLLSVTPEAAANDPAAPLRVSVPLLTTRLPA